MSTAFFLIIRCNARYCQNKLYSPCFRRTHTGVCSVNIMGEMNVPLKCTASNFTAIPQMSK